MNDSLLAKLSHSVLGKPMLQTGSDCTTTPAKPKSAKINDNPNSSGEFKTVESLVAVETMADEEVASLLAHFPA
jgi:hypothetical protein